METTVDFKSLIANILGWLFGLFFIAIGFINTFWGNDTFFGIFIMLVALTFFPTFNILLKKWLGFSIHWILKILLGIFILWAALGVGELFGKIDLMLMNF